MSSPIKNRLFLIIPLLAAICLTIFSWQFQSYLEEAEKNKFKQSLNTVLEISQQAIHSWSDEHKASVEIWANTPDVKLHTRQLIAELKANGNLLGSPQQERLRKLFAPVLKQEDIEGYFIIGPGNINLSSTRDENIGMENLLVDQSGLLSKWRAGETGMSVPQRSDVPLRDSNGRLVPDAPTMFVGAPILDEFGDVLAILTFRIDPDGDFNELLRRGRIGDSGETYAFNRDGVLISESRFDSQLVALGLIGVGEKSILNTSLRDPGEKLVAGQLSAQQRAQWPLTLMAKSALQSGSGANLDGYRGYMGNMVIGVWRWDETLDFGIASETRVEESYEHLYVTNSLTTTFTGLAILLITGLVAVYQVKNRHLEKADTLQRTVLNSIVDGIINVDLYGNIESANPAMESMFGYAANEMVGHNIELLIPGKQRSAHSAYLEQQRKTRDIEPAAFFNIRREMNGLRCNGEVFPIDIVVTEIQVEDKRLYNCVLRDTSDGKRKERLIKESEERFRVAFEAAAQGMCLVEPGGRFMKVNQALCDILAYTEAELLTMNFRDITYPDDLDKSITLAGELIDGTRRHFNMEKRYIRKDGSIVWALISSTMVRGETEQPLYFITQIIDITERKHAEHKLERAQKEASENRAKLTHIARVQTMGEMVTNVAHELNQPLAAIDMYAQAGLIESEKSPSNSDKIKTIFNKINTQSLRASDVIERIRSMLKRRELEVTKINVASLIAEVCDLVEADIKMGECQLEVSLENQNSCIEGDTILMQQVLVNLIRNAIDAISSTSTNEARIISVRSRRENGSNIMIDVADRGAGIDEETEKNLFKSFFTTKPEGMGVGLSISKNIVESYSGELWYSANPEGGSIFHIRLPSVSKR